MIKSRNTPQSLPSQRRHMFGGQDGPWSVSVAETPNDAQSFTLYIKTPTHNLTLIRAAFELVELDEKLRDAHPQVKKPDLPPALSSMPMPPKRKSAFLNTLSRLASPSVKLSPAKPSHGLRQTSISTTTPSTANSSSASPTNGTSNLPSAVSSPSNELNDPFNQVMSDADTSTLVPPNNPTITSLAAYLTNIANDQIHRQTRVWKRFVRVRTDDLESVRVERAIKRVRSDLAAHLKRPSVDIPGPGSISTSISKDDGDTVIVSTCEPSPLAPEPSPTTEDIKQPAQEEILPPSKVTQEIPKEHAISEKIAAEVPKPKEIREEPKNEVLILDSKDDSDATPVANETHTARIPRSQSADPTTRSKNFMASSLNDREGTLSQTSETTEDEESSIVSESKKYDKGRKKRAHSVDPNRELKKRSKKVAVDDFEMMRVLGKGCAGKVLLVRHKPTADLFALKAITKRHVLAHQELQHTLTEQAVLKRMAAEGKDPFVVKLWWSFHDREHLFLVMDFHPGGDLATQLARWGRLGRDRARFYAAEIVEGVEGLHKNGVIYRDLKPENVLIGSDGHIVLTDFGLSKEFPRRSNAITAPSSPNGTHGEFFANGAPSSPTLERDLPNGIPSTGTETTSTFCGTAEYLAPEVIQGLPYSFEVDWWSFGTMLYEMLTGITPFWANNHSDMYLRVLQDELQFPEDRSMDQDTKSLIRGLLQRNPALRIKEPRVKRHPYFSMIDWSHVYYKRYIPPYIPPIDPSNAGDTQNFDETFLDMDPVVKDAEDGEEQTDTDQDQQTDTDRTEGEDSVTTPSQSRSSSIHPQEAEVDVFDGYSFKGRHSVVIDDDGENSDLGDENDEYEEDEEEVISISKSPVSEDIKDQESALADTEDQAVETETEEERETEPRTPEARPVVTLPAEVPTEETKPSIEPTKPSENTELSAPTKRPSVDIPRPSIDSQRSETSSKSGKPPVPRPSKHTSKRREKSGIAALDKHIGDGIDELTEREEEDDWDIVESDVNEDRNGAKGTSLFARGVVDRYRLAVFRKSTPSRHGNRTSKASSTKPVSPSPSEKQSRGRTPLSFRNKKNILKTPPTSFSSRTSGTSKQHTLTHSSSMDLLSAGASSAVLNQSSATNTASPSLKSKQSAVSMTSPSESDFSPNEDTTRPGVLGGDHRIRKPVPPSPTDERKKKKKKLKGAEKVLSIFSQQRP